MTVARRMVASVRVCQLTRYVSEGMCVHVRVECEQAMHTPIFVVVVTIEETAKRNNVSAKNDEEGANCWGR